MFILLGAVNSGGKMKRRAKTKIVATIGPVSNNYTIIRKMMLAGLDVVRLNFSHGSHKSHLACIEIVRKLNKKYKRHIRILQDLEGYRIRVSKFKGKGFRVLEKNKNVWLAKGDISSDEKIIAFDYEGDLKKIKTGQLVYIDDGNIILKVVGHSPDKIKTEVFEGGILKERKGINMPGFKIPFSGITPKDYEDLEFGIQNKVDFVAQSFVRTKKDISTIKEKVKKYNPKCKVIAKIEARDAIRNIDEIINASDGIMVARGDMGVVVPIYEVPSMQKIIIKKCNKKKKFVITATEMLEHMTEHARPTRAEVSDVANAILDGTDYVMLSAESAAGKYPVESVKMMDKVIKFTESYSKKTDSQQIKAVLRGK